MSYILDALRKSEQERQATTPENVTERILTHTPPTQQRNKTWWLLLILVNLLGFASLFGYLLANKTQPKSQITATASIRPITPAAPLAPITPISNDPQTVVTKAEPATPSIAEMLSAQENTTRSTKLSAEKKSVPVKKVLPKQPVLHVENRRNYIEDYTPQSIPPYTPPPEIIKPELPAPAPAKKSKLTINVFSYAQQPEERFVIINMTKYKVGQQIDGETKLKEIHPDHIVLQQGGTVFKINRP
jgi:general secretion pathway protein B